MNRKKRTVSQQTNKKMHKEIKAAQKSVPAQKDEAMTVSSLLKSYPQKQAKAASNALQGFEKRWEANQKKQEKKRSKRTTPGKVDQKSPPAHIHVEGAYWIKNLTAQNKQQSKRLKKQLSKKK